MVVSSLKERFKVPDRERERTSPRLRPCRLLDRDIVVPDTVKVEAMAAARSEKAGNAGPDYKKDAQSTQSRGMLEQDGTKRGRPRTQRIKIGWTS